MRARSVVTLLTDFGGRDPFVGIMKGVILGIYPDTVLVDLCHEIPPHDILGGSFLLHTAAKAFPQGTVHVAVVDPGVGGPRRPILAELDGQVFVAPDNGVLSYTLASAVDRRIRQLTAQEYWLDPVSASFHGRDIFAPVAGHLAAGVEPARLGPVVDDPVLFPIPRPKVMADGSLQGTVLWVDRFGNCITNVAQGDLASLGRTGDRRVRVRVGERVLGTLVAYYGELAPGESGAILGSAGYVELFSNQRDLAGEWGIGSGDPVAFERGSG
jgi:S-adenosyl-L-methionine hydrolase (adenosine-forming)